MFSVKVKAELVKYLDMSSLYSVGQTGLLTSTTKWMITKMRQVGLMEKKLNQINAIVIGLVWIWRTSRKITFRGLKDGILQTTQAYSKSMTVYVQQYTEYCPQTNLSFCGNILRPLLTTKDGYFCKQRTAVNFFHKSSVLFQKRLFV